MSIKFCKDKGLAYAHESFALPNLKIPRINLEHITESMHDKDMPDIIYPMFHALRADKITRNKTLYPEKTLRGDARKNNGIYSMLRPYPIPFIMNHETGGGFFGGSTSEVYGRAVNSFMVNNALEGANAAAVILGVPHPHAIQQIMSGNWCTVSMGSRTEEATCGLCGADMISDPCEDCYEKEGFHVIMGAKGFQFREISNVLMPSDVGAQLQIANVDPQHFRLFASNPKQESVYDVTDPKRHNLLESAADVLQPIVLGLYESSKWLLDEFAGTRKQYFVIQESAKEKTPVEKEQKGMSIPEKELVQLPDTSFGVIYKDETLQKTIRRFPMFEGMTDDQKLFVKNQITNAKNLDADQKSALITSLEKSAVEDQVVVTIDEKNYSYLYDVLDEVSQEDGKEIVEEKEVVTGDNTQESNTETDELISLKEKIVALEAKIAETEEALKQEQQNRIELLSKSIARQQINLGEKIAKGKSVEELATVYATMDMTSIQALYTLVESTFDQVNITVTNVEVVENPVVDVVKPTENTTEAPGNADEDTDSKSDEKVISLIEDLAKHFGLDGITQSAQVISSQSNDILRKIK